MADKDTAKQMRRHYTQMVLFEAQQLMLVMMSDNVDATDDVDVSEKNHMCLHNHPDRSHSKANGAQQT
jgi:hypothetical protein